jgi:hypothetical protein
MITILSLINKLNYYKESHPNYYYLWITYILSGKNLNIEKIKDEIDNLSIFLDNNIDITESQLFSCLFTIQFII